MDVKARALGEPVSNQRRFVRAVVVHDDVDVESLRHPRVNQVEKLPELRGSMPLMKVGDHFARLRVECSKQRRGAVTRVVVGSVNVSLRCGCRPNECQMRLMAV